MKTTGLINDLNQTLEKLLRETGGLDEAGAKVTFEIPSSDQEWVKAGNTDPLVDLYLYDVRENRELREVGWDAQPLGNGRVNYLRRPMRLNLSYMVTCWGGAEVVHTLLWATLVTLARHSPLPNELLQGSLAELDRPIRTEVAQPEGVLKNVSDFWGGLNTPMRPSINLVVMLDLDLGEQLVSRLFSQKDLRPYASLSQKRSENLVYARVMKLGEADIARATDPRTGERVGPLIRKLMPPERYETLPLEWGATVREKGTGEAIEKAQVALMHTGADGQSHLFGVPVRTDAEGRFRFKRVPAGDYTVAIVVGDDDEQARKLEQSITLQPPPDGGNVSNLVFEVEAPMT